MLVGNACRNTGAEDGVLTVASSRHGVQLQAGLQGATHSCRDTCTADTYAVGGQLDHGCLWTTRWRPARVQSR